MAKQIFVKFSKFDDQSRCQKQRQSYVLSSLFKFGLTLMTLMVAYTGQVNFVVAQTTWADVDFGGKFWVMYDDAVVKGHNEEFMTNMNEQQCVQYCIDNVFSKPFDCWSVEWISGASYDENEPHPALYQSGNNQNGEKTACRPQSKTLFGSTTGYGSSSGTKLYERSCQYVNQIGLNLNAAYDIVDTVNVEYEVEINSSTKPFFMFGLTPYPETSMLNCRVDLTFTVDGGSCSIAWDPDVSTSTSAGRWSSKVCTVNGNGLGSNIQLQMGNDGKVTVMSASPYSEDIFHYKIEANVVGYSTFSLEGDFKLLCASKLTTVTTPAIFSTDIIGFLKDSGTHSFKFEELVTNQCPIIKYEIDSYTSNMAFDSQINQVQIDTTEAGCLTGIQTGNLAYYSEVGKLCKTIIFKSDVHLEKHRFRIKSTSQGILHAKGTKIQYSDWIEVEIVCGPTSTSGISVPTLTPNFFYNQQYLPGSTNAGWISPKHISQKSECQMDHYQMISSDDVSDRSTCTLTPVKYQARRTSLSTAVTELTNFQCSDQNDGNRIFSKTGKTLTSCKSECATAGGTSQRMQSGSTCECFSQECTTVMMNNIKGADKANWITYKWECISQNIMTSVFSNANDAILTVTDTSKKIIMIHPTEMLGSNKALVSQNVVGTFQPLLSDGNTLRTETFYVLSKADGGKQLVSGPYTTKIACDQTITVSEVATSVPDLLFVLPLSSNIHRVTINAFDVKYPDEPSRSISAYCPILTYSPSASSEVVSLQAGCTQPCRIFDFVNTKPITHSTTVAVTVTGGASFTSAIPITAKIVCGPQSTVLTLPTISTPYAYPLIPNSSQLPQVELDDGTSQTSECPIESWTLTSDGLSNSNLVNIQNTVFKSDGKTIIKVTDTIATKTIFGTYQFYLTYLARGGQTLTTPQITLNTICFIDVPTVSSHIYQIIKNDVSLPNVQFTDSVDVNACVIASIAITADGVADKNLNGLDSTVVRAGGKTIILVLPANVNLLKTYKFYLMYTSQDGQVKTSPQISLIVDCGPLSGDITLPTINSPYTYEILEFDTDVPFVKLAKATYTGCPIQEWTLTSDGVSNTVLDRIQPTVVVDSITGETTIKVTTDSKHEVSEFKFYLTYTARGGSKITTSKITLKTVCGPKSTTISYPKLSSPYNYDLVYNDPSLPQVALSYPQNSIAACPVEKFVLTSDGISNTVLDRVQNTVTRSNGFDYVKINADQVANIGTFSFFLTYIAKGGSQTTTPEIMLNTKCAKGSTKIEAPTIESPQFIELGTSGSGFTFDKFVNNHKFCKDLDYKITDKRKQQHASFEQTVQFESKLIFKLINVNEKQQYDDIYILNTARGGEELFAGPYSLIVDCKNQSACGVQKVEEVVETDITLDQNTTTNKTNDPSYLLLDPGRKTWEQFNDFATAQGGRLPTLAEGQKLTINGALVEGDIWVAVGDLENQEWMEIGDETKHYPGKPLKEIGGDPGWGNDLDQKTDFKYTIVMKVDNIATVTVNSTNDEVEPSSSTSTFIQPQNNEIGKAKAKVVTELEKDLIQNFSWTPPPKDARNRQQSNLPVILELNDITRSGLVTIQFNQDLNIPKRFTNITRKLASNDDVFEISLGNKEGEKQMFEHEIVNWSEKGIEIQLNFENPIEISANSLSLAKIVVKKPDLFVSKDTGQALQQLGEDELHFIKLVPRQVPDDINVEDLNKSAHSTSLFLLVIIIVQLFIAFCLNAEMHLFWTFMSMIQIVVYMPIIKVNLPPNTEIYLEAIRHIAEFQLWDPHPIVSAIGSIFSIAQYIPTNPESEEYKNAGFRTLNFWDNMKYYFFLLSCFLFVILIIFICSFFKRCEPRSSKMLKKIKKKWTWSNTLRTLSVLFLYIIISYSIAIKEEGKPFIITIGTVIAAYPIWTILFLIYKGESSLTNKVVMEKYWALYGNLRYKELSSLFYPLISCARKAVFVVGAIMLTKWSYFQVQLFTLLNIFYSIYFAYVHPNARIMDFRLEVFNEWAIQIMCFHLMCFTDMVQITTEKRINYLLGQSFNFFSMLVILFNLAIFGHSLIRPIKNYHRRRQFRKALPALIQQRQLQRQQNTKKANVILENKINSIIINYKKNQEQSEAKQDLPFDYKKEQDQKSAQSMEFKKQFFLDMQARNRQQEIERMRNLNEDHDTITKKVFKDRKHDKMMVDDEQILFSSSSDDDDITKTVAPTLKHVFNHKFFDNLKTIPMQSIKEDDENVNITQRKSRNQEQIKTANPTDEATFLNVLVEVTAEEKSDKSNNIKFQ